MPKYSVASDPKGLIFEAYRIPGITINDCRSIFFDWVLSLKDDLNPNKEILLLHATYAGRNQNHPMNLVLQDGLKNMIAKPKRRKRIK